MELRDLRALVAVVRLGSFTRAADQLGYTQSAVSQQIGGLERELGTSLVRRRPVRATPAGERLAQHAERILLRLDVARSELAGLREDEQTLAIAITPLTTPSVLAGALRRLRAGRPGLSARVCAVELRAAVAQVASGAVHAALVDGVATPNEPLELADAGLLVSRRVAEAPLGVVLSLDHPLLSLASVDLETLADAPWVATPRLLDDDGRLGDLGAGRRKGYVVYDGLDVATLLALVAVELGAALLPASVDLTLHGVAWRPLRRPAIVHRTELVTLREPTPLTARLVAAFRG